MNEGLRLMTPDEYLTKLKAEGYDYFLHNDDIYQYEDGKLLHVFGEGVELVISKDINTFKVAEFPEDYLSMIGLSHDFVAFMVAKKAEIIILDESNLPIAQYGPDYPNVPSAFLHRYDFKGIANMLVRYEAPGYPSEGHLTFDKDVIAKKQSRYHKVIHNGNFFYPGFESKLSLGDYTASFKYYAGTEYHPEVMESEDHYEEYTLLPATDNPEKQLIQVINKMKELFMEMDWSTNVVGAVPFKNIQINHRHRPIHLDDKTTFETVISLSAIHIANGELDSDLDGNLYPEGIWFANLVSDQALRYSIDRIVTILEQNGIVHRETIDFEEHARRVLSVMELVNEPYKIVGHTVSVRRKEKECPLGYMPKEREKLFRTPEDYPEMFGPFPKKIVPADSAFPDPGPTKSVPVSFEHDLGF